MLIRRVLSQPREAGRYHLMAPAGCTFAFLMMLIFILNFGFLGKELKGGGQESHENGGDFGAYVAEQ